ncbi:MAG: HAMP domain-containing histidine kinase [Gemmatimonadota bacterium]|nr:HAMP domain-containing histidine kinase [Gemmatimonadota bacterium]MDH3367997.1 HAMP domain-containing histidine kinase [Gemmatimonadota bacterium]MDH3479480.1 HAMP domain-containing histidine kinase [Gemmatimonadota bacterium]
MRRSLRLRTRFMLVVLLGAIVPLALVGLWLTRTTERSGEALLRSRLDASLAQVARESSVRWTLLRSRLLDLGEHDDVREALAAGDSDAQRQVIEALWSRVVRNYDDVEEIDLRDADGTLVVRLLTDPAVERNAAPPVSGSVPVSLVVHAAGSPARLGTLHAQIRLTSLLPSAPGWSSVGGSVLGVFQGATGTALLPLTIDESLFSRSRFQWMDDTWITARRRLEEPPLELVLAAPVGPFSEPFREAAGRGTIALVVVAGTVLVLVALLTQRVTRSLSGLAVAADAVAAGNLGRWVDESGGEEIGRVAHAFNQMTTSLQQTLRRLAERESLAAVGEFAASLAHEIRNPLSAVRVDLQRADEKSANPEARKLIERTLRSIQRLDATVTGALRVARSGNVERHAIDLRTPLAAAMESAEPEFATHRARLDRLPDGPAPLPVEGDAAALEQLFLNLLLNAAQALEPGGRAGVSVAQDDGSITVSVWDSGHGVSPEARERLFEPFFSTKPDGTGLGLAVARRIAAAHGGDIRAEGREPCGTTMRVRLPRSHGSTSAIP